MELKRMKTAAATATETATETETETKKVGEMLAKLQKIRVDKKQVESICEHVLYFLCGLCSCDCACLPLFLNVIKGKLIRRRYHDQLAEIAAVLKTHGTKKELVHVYFSSKARYLPYQKLVDRLPQVYRMGRIAQILKEIADTIKDTTKTENTYCIKAEQYVHFDPFYYGMQDSLSEVYDKTEELHKKLANPAILNPLFGNITRCSDNLNLCDVVSHTLATCGIDRLICPLLSHTLRGITETTTIYALKLWQCTAQYMPPDAARTCEAAYIAIKPLLQDKMRTCAELFTPPYRTLERSTSETEKSGLPALERAQSTPMDTARTPGEEEKALAKAKKLKVLEEFKQKSARFAAHNQQLIAPSAPSETHLCSICKEALNPENFLARPYGHLVQLTHSNGYMHCLRQRLERERWLELNSKADIQVEGVTIQSCGHFVHHSCLQRKTKSEKESQQEADQVMQMLGLQNEAQSAEVCMLCKAPYKALVPPRNCWTLLDGLKDESLLQVKGVLHIICKEYQQVDLTLIPEQEKDLLEMAAKLISYAVQLSEVNGVADLQSKADQLRAVLAIVHSSIRGCARDLPAFIQQSLPTTAPSPDRLLSCDWLMHVARLLGFLKLQDVKEQRLGEVDNAIKCALRMHVWQVIIKLLLAEINNKMQKSTLTSIINPKNIERLLQTRGVDIKRIVLPWLRKALLLREVIYEHTTIDLTLFNDDQSLDDAKRFDLLITAAGYPEDLLERVLIDPLSSPYNLTQSYSAPQVLDIVSKWLLQLVVLSLFFRHCIASASIGVGLSQYAKCCLCTVMKNSISARQSLLKV